MTNILKMAFILSATCCPVQLLSIYQHPNPSDYSHKSPSQITGQHQTFVALDPDPSAVVAFLLLLLLTIFAFSASMFDSFFWMHCSQYLDIFSGFEEEDPPPSSF